MGKKSARRAPQPVVAVVAMGDVLEVLKAIADADAVKADIAQSGADSFDHWITEQLRPKAAPGATTNGVDDANPSTYDLRFAEDDPFIEKEPTKEDQLPDLNAMQGHQPRHVTAYVVQGLPADVAEVLRNI